jgi:hypothetical protein
MRQLRQLEWKRTTLIFTEASGALSITALPSFIVRSASLAANPGRQGDNSGKTDE